MPNDIGETEARLRAFFASEIEAAARDAPPPPRLPARQSLLPDRQARIPEMQSRLPARSIAGRADAAGRGSAGDAAASVALAACLAIAAVSAFPRQAEGRLATIVVAAAASGRLEEVRIDMAAGAASIWETGLARRSRGDY
ncbi:MAG: hypothetical protein KKA67_05010 [Spirochaetes bacterium]|nr:hypothetical protein [Spirochaetota bacterium]MBU1081692.1 hypothetical protein [Spirochaetota bacterium]